MAQPGLVPTGKDAVSSTENSLDFLQRFSLTSQGVFQYFALALRGGGGDSPSSRSVATLGARSLGALELGTLATAACTASPDCGLKRT